MRKFILLWVCGVVLICLVLVRPFVVKMYRLADHGVASCAILESTEPNNHETVHYSYEAHGKLYSGHQQGGAGHPAESLTSPFPSGCGQFVAYYLPENPSISLLGDPKAALRNEETFIAIAAFIFPFLALLGWSYRDKSFRDWLKR